MILIDLDHVIVNIDKALYFVITDTSRIDSSEAIYSIDAVMAENPMVKFSLPGHYSSKLDARLWLKSLVGAI